MPDVRRLTDDERELVAYLRDGFGMRGAASYVRRYGGEVWRRALSDFEAMPDSAEIRNPVGLLIWMVRDLSDGRG